MRLRILTSVLLATFLATAAKADILIVGGNGNDGCFGHISKMMTDTRLNFVHEDSCGTFGETVDIVIFRNSCSDKVISEVKRLFKKNEVSFAVESDTSRVGISKLIPTSTAVANAMSTMLCDKSEHQVSYAAACCWYRSVTGKDSRDSGYRPSGIRDEVIEVLQICGNEAVMHPGIRSVIDEHPYLPALNSQWKGKKVIFLGDSITDKSQIAPCNDVYWHMLKKMLGIIPFVYGISGHQMSHILGQAAVMEKDLGDDFDAIVIFAGTNDYNASVPIGEWYTYSPQNVNDHGTDTILMHREPSKDESTFKGRINIVLDSLKSHYPGKQIILMTPIHRSWANFGGNNIQPDESFCNRAGLYIDIYSESIREASSIWSVPVIDLFSESGLNPGIASHSRFFRHPEKDNRTGFHDLLHPNTAGHILMAYTIAYKMMAIPCFPNL